LSKSSRMAVAVFCGSSHGTRWPTPGSST
jgi:hypothetical protein